MEAPIESFGRVTENIIRYWKSPTVVSYLQDLMVVEKDTNRKGFTWDAMSDILFLSKIASYLHPEKKEQDDDIGAIWNNKYYRDF